MKLESQVCSLDLAKKLKELGVRQESHFRWDEIPFEPGIAVLRPTKSELYDYSNLPAAFTVAELGEMFPKEISDGSIAIGRPYDQWQCTYLDNDNADGQAFRVPPFIAEADTEAGARAKLLIYLIESNLLKVAQINQPES